MTFSFLICSNNSQQETLMSSIELFFCYVWQESRTDHHRRTHTAVIHTFITGSKVTSRKWCERLRGQTEATCKIHVQRPRIERYTFLWWVWCTTTLPLQPMFAQCPNSSACVQTGNWDKFIWRDCISVDFLLVICLFTDWVFCHRASPFL